MKRTRFIIGAICLLIPLVARTLWFYQGFYHRTEEVQIPHYESLTVPVPDIKNAAVEGVQPVEGTPVVVFDIYHSNYFNLSEIDSLTGYLEEAGARIEVYDGMLMLSDHLRYASALVIIAPTLIFSADEMEAVDEFVHKGGRLLVIADPTRNYESSMYYYYGYYMTSPYTTVDVVNLLLESYGIEFHNDYVYNILENEGNYRNVFLHPVVESPLLEDLSTLVFYGAHSLQTDNALIKAGEGTCSSFTDSGGNLTLVALAQEGRVLAMGDMTFMTAPFSRVEDNQQFIINIAQFLSTSERVFKLEDYPYIFNDEIKIVLPSEDVMDAGQLALVSSLKETLENQAISVSISSENGTGGDRIFIGTFPPSEALQPYVGAAGLVFEESDMTLTSETRDIEPTPEPAMEVTEEAVGEEVIVEENANEYEYDSALYEGEFSDSVSEYVVSVPGLGKLEADTFGFFLYLPEEEGNTYIILVKSSENYQAMADLLTSGNLSRCSFIGNLAICDLGTAGSVYY